MLTDEAPITRDRLLDELTRRKIGIGVHYRGVHLHPYYRDTYGLVPEQLPVATRISERTLSLPLSPKVTHRDQDDVLAALNEVLTAA
jgi:dTDP-4-amino-4,6-dideoxygalactose transaminase